MTMTELSPRAEVARLTPEIPAEAPGGLLAMIERLAVTPNVNVDTLERLLAMQERVIEREARAAYTQAMVDMKPNLPVIDRKGRIEVREKTNTGKRDGDLVQSTAFARWEDIDAAITPILKAHGFALTFRSGVAHDGKITVTGVLSHRAGHFEETTITLPHDSTGSKNPVQAVGSSTSYGKRYTATLLLNIRTKGEDDDGKAGGALSPIQDDQRKAIEALLTETESDWSAFCEFWQIDGVADLPAVKYPQALMMLQQRKKVRGK